MNDTTWDFEVGDEVRLRSEDENDACGVIMSMAGGTARVAWFLGAPTTVPLSSLEYANAAAEAFTQGRRS